MALSNFGSPKYGGSIMGKLIYVDKDYKQDFTCSPPCRFACQDFSSATPKLDLRLDSKENYIMLIDRGPVDAGTSPCKFAEKVWNAQGAGAKGAIVVNYEDRLTTMEAPDSDDEANYKYLANITIPATFITKSSGDALKGLLRRDQAVYVTMDWTDALPKKQQVSWEFWTNSNDECGPVCEVQREFVKAMVPVAKEFDQHGWTRFTPHYIVWVCPASYRSTAECRSQCVRQGRYCSPDPDGNLKEGYSGADVVQENLRELCVFKLANASGRPFEWWDYVTRFAEQCQMDEKKYGQECGEKVFEQLNSDGWSSLDALRQCIGDQNEDSDHPIMEEQLVAQRGNDKEGEVFILPTIRVNDVQYRGKLAVTEVLRAICAGFTEGNRPDACNRVVDDACMQGGKGYAACAARTDGKTQCINTFTGYNCTCGHGFISHINPTSGEEECLDINECLSISHLDPNCTCERCACKNTYGGYQCITDLPNECDTNYGGCWHGEHKVAGKTVEFSGCKDNIKDYKDALAHNQPVGEGGVPLHTCACPPCFNQVERGGAVSCEPKCDLRYCDLDLGICHLPPDKGGLGVGAIVGIVLSILAVVAGAGYVAYRWRLRGMMQGPPARGSCGGRAVQPGTACEYGRGCQAEVRAIMAQYMPLSDVDNKPNGV
ncbi:hypothetical protein N2152v2_005510 [Parachlorella kessleri]